MLPKIPPYLFDVYRPVSTWESFYLRTRWRLCPYELVVSLLPEKGIILDLGCGYGMLANLLALKSTARSVVGIDLNRERIRVAQRTVKNRENIAFHWGDIESLNTGKYDAIVMTDVLHHIGEPHITTLLKRASSLLHSTGMLIILDVDKKPIWKYSVAHAIDKSLNPKARLHYHSAGEMGQMLERHSITVEKIISAHRGLPLSDIIYLCTKQYP